MSNSNPAPKNSSSSEADEEALVASQDVSRTNDESTVSKRSAARAGYVKDAFLRHFVKRPSNRSPLINRGYYARLLCVRAVLRAFVQHSGSRPKQVLSLGAGFDTSFFSTVAADLIHNVCYFEVDMPSVVENKTKQILGEPTLANLLSQACPRASGLGLTSFTYRLLPCDLADVLAMHKILVSSGLDPTQPTLIFAECVMQYLPARASDAVFKWIHDNFCCSIVLAFDQVLPPDVFGKSMVQNLKQKGSPLLGIDMYGTPAAHEARYKHFGFERVAVIGFQDFVSYLQSSKEQTRVERLEPFDEWEDWFVMAEHYILSVATSMAPEQLKTFPSIERFFNIPAALASVRTPGASTTANTSSTLGGNSWKLDGAIGFKGWGHSISVWHQASQDVLVLFGGYAVLRGLGAGTTQCRSNRVLQYFECSNQWVVVEVTGDLPLARVHHATAILGSDQLILFGGRGDPCTALNDIFRLDLAANHWSRCNFQDSTELPIPRYRHSLVAVTSDHCLLYGGRTSYVPDECAEIKKLRRASSPTTSPEARFESEPYPYYTLDDIWLYCLSTNEWTQMKLPAEGCCAPARRCAHACVVIEARKLIVYGGLDSFNQPLSDLWILELSEDLTCGTWVPFDCIPASPPVFSHTMTQLSDSTLLILSSVPYSSTPLNGSKALPYGASLTFTIDLCSKALQQITLPSLGQDTVPLESELIFTRHCAAVVNQTLCITGGGCMCFSFGTHFNRFFRLPLASGFKETSLPTSPPSSISHASLTCPCDVPGASVALSTSLSTSVHKCVNLSEWKANMATRLPVVATGVPLGTCVSAWVNMNYLCQLTDDAKVYTHISTSTPTVGHGLNSTSYEFKPLHEILLHCTSASSTNHPPYVHYRSSAKNLPSKLQIDTQGKPSPSSGRGVPCDFWKNWRKLASDFHPPAELGLMEKDHYEQSALHVLTPGTIVGWRYEILDMVLCIANGVVSVSLISPLDIKSVLLPSGTLVKELSSEVCALPSFRKLTLRGGDIIFIPALWPLSLASESTEGVIAVSVSLRPPFPVPQPSLDFSFEVDLKAGRQVKRLAQKLAGELSLVPMLYRDFTKRQIQQKLNQVEPILHIDDEGGKELAPFEEAFLVNLENPSQETWRRCYDSSTPCVMKNIKFGPCVDLWTVDYLSTHETKLVSVHESTTGSLDFVNKNFSFVTIPFGALVQRTLGPNPVPGQLYFRSMGTNMRKDPSDIWKNFEIAKDFQIPEFMEASVKDKIFQSVLRIGSPALQVFSHYDIMDTILFQVKGEKKVVIFPPCEIDHLYVTGSASAVIDLDNWDRTRFPRFEKAKRNSITCHLKAGDAVFIPALWFHNPSSKHSGSVTIELFVRNLPREMYERKDLYANKDLLCVQKVKSVAEELVRALKETPEAAREVYKRIALGMIDKAVQCVPRTFEILLEPLNYDNGYIH